MLGIFSECVIVIVIVIVIVTASRESSNGFCTV